jgi:hypothetical protein
VEQGGTTEEEYIRQVLEAYLKTPGTTGTVRRPDRLLASPTATTRGATGGGRKRFCVGSGPPPDTASRCPSPGHDSLAGIFSSGDQEVLTLRVHPDYFRYLRQKMERSTRQ